jgi:hypothetical protein
LVVDGLGRFTDERMCDEELRVLKTGKRPYPSLMLLAEHILADSLRAS